MAKASAGGGGPDILLIGAVGLMAFMALRSGALGTARAATVLPATAQPDYKAQRDLIYAQAGVGLAGGLAAALGNLFQSGTPENIFGGSTSIPYGSRTGGALSTAIEFNRQGGQMWNDGFDGFSLGQFGSTNGAYSFGSPVEAPALGKLWNWGS